MPLTGTGHYTPHNKGMISPAYGMGIMAVKAKVDRETGHVEAQDVLVVHDSGQIINPLGARGQVEGGANIVDVNLDDGLLDGETVMPRLLKVYERSCR